VKYTVHVHTNGDVKYSDEKNIIRVIKSKRVGRVGHMALMEEKRRAYRFLVGKFERKSLLGSPRRRWEDKIK
jgi:hypothetical protein